MMMKTTTFKRLIGAAALAALPLFAQAQELKIGYVNSERVLRESAAARAIAARRRPDGSGRGFFVRCERQTLRRLPDTAGVLFTIRIHLSPLGALAGHPRALAEFDRAWGEAPADYRRYKGLAAVAPGVEAFLAAHRPETAARPSQGVLP